MSSGAAVAVASPCLCRRAQRHQPGNGRKLLVAAALGEGVLIPAGDAAAWIVGEGEQPFVPVRRTSTRCHRYIEADHASPVRCPAGRRQVPTHEETARTSGESVTSRQPSESSGGSPNAAKLLGSKRTTWLICR